MNSKQREIIESLKVTSDFEASAEIQKRIDFLYEYAMTLPNCQGFVLGISGGQDSTLAGKIAQLAADRLKSERPEAFFYALRLPYGEQFDEQDALDALSFIEPDRACTIQIKTGVDALAEQIHEGTSVSLTDFNLGNIKARMRMTAQYAVGAHFNLLVVGSDHAAEAVTGFYTKHGDGAADVMPLSGLTKGQGREMLQKLDAPDHLWKKVPTADLLNDDPGQSDEAALGVSYLEIDSYLLGQEVQSDVAQNIENKYALSQHKRHMPVTPFDSWWKNE